MSRVVVLHTGVLGLLVHPGTSLESEGCRHWLEQLRLAGDQGVVPEITDYELRRELTRRRALTSLRRLDALQQSIYYAPLTTAAMRQAAAFWAQARQQGRPAAPDLDLDADMILVAQAALLTNLGDPIVIATTNVKHLSIFADARLWQNI